MSEPLTLRKLSFPQELHIQLPYSKSVGARQLLNKYLHGEPLPSLDSEGVAHRLYSDDLLVLHQALTELSQREGRAVVSVNCGDSGTAFRFLTVTALYEPAPTLLIGSSRLIERIRQDDLSFVEALGGSYRFDLDACQLQIFPPEQVGETHLTCEWHSSQYLSAIELCNVAHGSRVTYDFDASMPSYSYLQLTKQMIAHGFDGELERDWSGASFWYQLLATTAQIETIYFDGLTLKSSQPDAQLSHLFEGFGVKTTQVVNGIKICQSVQPTSAPLLVDLSQNLDLFLPLALTALALGIPFSFRGIAKLRHKESDRIASFVENVRNYGYPWFTATEDSISWDGKRDTPSTQVTIDPDRDHRVAMAFAIFATSQPQTTTTLLTPDVVAKSYPTFFHDLLN